MVYLDLNAECLGVYLDLNVGCLGVGILRLWMQNVLGVGILWHTWMEDVFGEGILRFECRML